MGGAMALRHHDAAGRARRRKEGCDFVERSAHGHDAAVQGGMTRRSPFSTGAFRSAWWR